MTDQKGNYTNRTAGGGDIKPLRGLGATLREIADALNGYGVLTARGGRWQASQVQRVLARLGVAN